MLNERAHNHSLKIAKKAKNVRSFCQIAIPFNFFFFKYERVTGTTLYNVQSWYKIKLKNKLKNKKSLRG
mgnify:CR=1 FL=1